VVVVVQPSTAREMVVIAQKMEKDVEAKRRKLNVSSIDEKNQKYLKQLKGAFGRLSVEKLCVAEAGCLTVMYLILQTPGNYTC